MSDERNDELESLRGKIAQLNHQQQQEVEALDALVRISTQLNSTLKLSELLQHIIGAAKSLLAAEACSIALRDEETDELVFRTAVGEGSQEVHNLRVPAGRGIAGQVVETGQPVVVNSTRNHPRFFDQIDQATGFHSRNMLALPIQVKQSTIGVMEVINSQGREAFDERDLRLGQALANLAAVAIDNANLYQKLADALVVSRMSYRL